ncbi:MAG: hypothetical protein K9G46_02735 [Flavobacteriales bacterium]|nr:hypothetical protein [Flavobacteriales bacterium]
METPTPNSTDTNQLNQALEELLKAKAALESLRSDKGLQEHLPSSVMKAFNNSIEQLDMVIEPMRSLINSIEAIRQEILGPFQSALDKATYASIATIKSSSRKSNRMSVAFGVIGIIGVAFSFLSGSGMRIFGTTEASTQMNASASRTADTTNPESLVYSWLGVSELDFRMESHLDAYANCEGSNQKDCYERLQSGYKMEFAKINVNTIDENDKLQASFYWILIESLKETRLAETEAQANTALSMLLSKSDSSDMLWVDAVWLQIQIDERKGHLEQALKGLKELTRTLSGDRTVFNIETQTFFEISPSVLKQKSTDIETLLYRRSARVVLLDGAGRGKQKLDSFKDILVSHGFSAENIRCVSSKAVSEIFGYYDSPQSLKELTSIIEIIYPNRSTRPNKDFTPQPKIGNLQVRQCFKTDSANIVIRLPKDSR